MKTALPVLAMLFTVMLVHSADGQGPAARPKPAGLSPQDQRRFNDLMQSGDRSMSQGMWLALICSCVCGFMLAYGAYNTFRNGLRVNKERVIKGATANVIAGVLLLAALAIPLVTWFYLEELRI